METSVFGAVIVKVDGDHGHAGEGQIGVAPPTQRGSAHPGKAGMALSPRQRCKAGIRILQDALASTRPNLQLHVAESLSSNTCNHRYLWTRPISTIG